MQQIRALLLATLAGCTPAPTDAQVVAFTNATIIDGTGSAPSPATTIVVRDGRITAVQPASAAVPAGALVHDLTGKFVTPGLIDAHVHLGTQRRPPGVMEMILRSVFMGGVTAVRDMGAHFDSLVPPLAAKGNTDSVPMPRVSVGYFVRNVRSPEAVAPAVAAAKAAGARGIKIYNNVRPDLLTSVADEARRNGLRVWSHLWVDPGAPSAILAARSEVVSHADMYVAELLTPADRSAEVPAYRDARHVVYANPKHFEHASFAPLLRAMKDQGTILDATLTIMRPAPDSTGRVNERRAALWAGALQFVRRAREAGIDVATGTDAIGGSTPNLHIELQLLVDSAGFTPLQAIRAATSVGARAIGIPELGTIAPGRIADLLVLDADPTVDIANTIRVHGVAKSGQLFRRERPMPTPPGARSPK